MSVTLDSQTVEREVKANEIVLASDIPVWGGDDDASSEDERGSITLGVILAGSWAADLGAGLDLLLSAVLSQRYPAVNWSVSLTQRRVGPRTTQLTEMVEQGREVLLDQRWDLALLVTDLPARWEKQPVQSHASPSYGVGILSLPALGPVQARRRVLPFAQSLVGQLLGEDPTEAAPADGRQQQQTLRRLRQLAAEPVKGAGPLRAVRTLGSNAHLLSGMVRANRPWRLATGLYRSMVAALAFVCFAVLGQGIWQLAVTMGAIRLGIASVASMGVMIVAIIWVHSLWERGHTSKAREQALLFNAVTVSTLLIGVATLYIAVMIAAFLIGELVIPARVLGGVLHRNAGIVQYIELAWLIASLATVGGALGSAVESETAIREATYPFATGE